jgi:membrane-associated phospholipid phosphatase
MHCSSIHVSGRQVSSKVIKFALLIIFSGAAVPYGLRAQTVAGPSAQAFTISAHRISEFCMLTPRTLCTLPPPSFAPEKSEQRSPASDLVIIFKRFPRDQIGILAAPFRPSNLKWDALFLAGTGIVIATDKHTTGAVGPDHINISRDISNVGFYGTSAVTGALWVSGVVTHNDHARETGVIAAEALADAFPLYIVVRYSLGRQRPNEGNGHGLFFKNRAYGSSFPSGHALFTWTMASVIAHEYPPRWVKFLAYGTAAAVSITRFTGREHFVADVAVGSALGYLIGRHIFNAHCNEEFSVACHNPTVRED